VCSADSAVIPRMYAGDRPQDQPDDAQVREHAVRGAQGEGHDGGEGAEPGDGGRQLLWHHDDVCGRRGWYGERRVPHHGGHHAARAADHQDGPRHQPRLLHLLHAFAGAGMLPCPRSSRAPTAFSPSALHAKRFRAAPHGGSTFSPCGRSQHSPRHHARARSSTTTCVAASPPTLTRAACP
jgi:hypothetical protein